MFNIISLGSNSVQSNTPFYDALSPTKLNSTKTFTSFNLQNMCSPSRRISKCGQGNYPTVVCYVILCLVICIHHSHQENNLSLDKIKDEENNHNAANVSLDLNLSPIFPDHDRKYLKSC